MGLSFEIDSGKKELVKKKYFAFKGQLIFRVNDVDYCRWVVVGAFRRDDHLILVQVRPPNEDAALTLIIEPDLEWARIVHLRNYFLL